jgi:hypothetical protein
VEKVRAKRLCPVAKLKTERVVPDLFYVDFADFVIAILATQRAHPSGGHLF